MAAVATGPRAGHTAARTDQQPKKPAAGRTGSPAVGFTVGGPAPVTQVGSPTADTTAAADTVADPHNGGIDRPRTVLGSPRSGSDGVTGWATGVVSISNRSFGVHSKAVHNAARVESFTWAGCLVNSADAGSVWLSV